MHDEDEDVCGERKMRGDDVREEGRTNDPEKQRQQA